MDIRIKQFVDNGIKLLQDDDLMYAPDPNMPIEMIDTSKNKHDDWIPWKPIASTVSLNEIKYIESILKYSFPQRYIEYLQYLHFYEIYTATDIVFFPLVIHRWKDEFLKNVFDTNDPDYIINKGYIYIGDHEDYGAICFDTQQGDNDYPIVIVDYNTDYSVSNLFPNFMKMIDYFIESQLKIINQ